MKFSRFTVPTQFTPVPDELFDELLPSLSGGELKVVLYIIRRTWGFGRPADAIGFKQLLNGLPGCDSGTGLSSSTLRGAIQSLRKRGVISVEERTAADGGQAPSVYQLCVKNHHGGTSENRAGGTSENRYPQYTEERDSEVSVSGDENHTVVVPSNPLAVDHKDTDPILRKAGVDPPSREPEVQPWEDPAQLTYLRNCLITFATYFRLRWGSPDDELVRQTLLAGGGLSAVEIVNGLDHLRREGKRPSVSWGWFPKMAGLMASPKGESI